MNAPVSRMQRKRSQRGFSLVELMIALAVSAIIVVGTMTILRYLVIVSADNRAETMAILQVQYVGFWISEDVVQAQYVDPHESESGGTGFPLTVEWTEWDGDLNRVVYRVEGMVDRKGSDLGLWALYRKHVVIPVGQSEIDYGESLVGQYLDPGRTRSFWDKDLGDVLVLQVAATVDGNEANSTYQINPRALR